MVSNQLIKPLTFISFKLSVYMVHFRLLVKLLTTKSFLYGDFEVDLEAVMESMGDNLLLRVLIRADVEDMERVVFQSPCPSILKLNFTLFG